MDRITFLRKEISKHNEKYYVENNPTISDKEFDMLMKELELLEAEHPGWFDPNSPTQKVGSDLKNGFAKVKHLIPMLSLTNTYNKAEIADIFKNIKFEITYSGEVKFDGASIGLIYEYGLFAKAVTRGDKTEGDDVTENAKTIFNIPLKLNLKNPPPRLEIRGEVVMTHASFAKANEYRKKIGKDVFVNPRNAAAGTLKNSKSSEVAKTGLVFQPFQLLSKDLDTGSHFNNMQFVRTLGFNVSEHIVKCSSIEEVWDFIEKIGKLRKSLPFDIDGIVVKIDETNLYEKIGFSAKSPKWATSYKFNAEQATTRLLSIEYTVGRTGKITPVANLEPVQLAGTTVKRASLHNADQIELLGVRVGDYVIIEKGGEIIPKIVDVDLDARTNPNPEIFPEECPYCGTTLIRLDDEANHYCPNKTTCTPQLKGYLEYVVSRKAMNINIGEKGVEALVDFGLVKCFSDFYKLDIDDIEALPGYQLKGATKIWESIQESKKQPFQKVLYSLGIDQVGESTSKLLIENGLNSFDKISQASYEQLVNIPEIGHHTATAIKNWFGNLANLSELAKLKSLGLAYEAIEERAIEQSSSVLLGKKVLYTGTFENYTRNEIEEMIKTNGGKKGSISKSLDLLIVGDGAGPSKLANAKNLGIRMVSINKFLDILKNGL